MSKGSIYKILTSNMPDGWHRVKVGKKYFNCYYKDNRKVIHIWQYDEMYRATLTSSDIEDNHSYFVKDSSLDALKFKTLLKAIELGWKVELK